MNEYDRIVRLLSQIPGCGELKINFNTIVFFHRGHFVLFGCEHVTDEVVRDFEQHFVRLCARLRFFFAVVIVTKEGDVVGW